MSITRRSVLLGLAAAPLGACASISPMELGAIGNRIDEGKVDFRALQQAAARADDARLGDADIRAKWPQTVRIASIDRVGVRYFVERDDRSRIQRVAFPGSENVRDWVEDFDIFLRPDARTGIPLHRGFEEATTAAYADMRPHLRQAYAVEVAGYSMGAGLAAILTAYLTADGFRVQRTTTFGQPRVTNAAGVQRLASLPITRVVNSDDFVSMVPTFPFEHFGEEVILHPGPDYVYLTHADANRISIGELWRDVHRLVVENHLMTTYRRRLDEKLQGARSVPYLTRLA